MKDGHNSAQQDEAARLSPWSRHAVVLTMVAGFTILIVLVARTYTAAPPIPQQVVNAAGESLFLRDHIAKQRFGRKADDWHAQSPEFLSQDAVRRSEWARLPADAIFIALGVLPAVLAAGPTNWGMRQSNRSGVEPAAFPTE
jgi:nitric oxide reductase large subunit